MAPRIVANVGDHKHHDGDRREAGEPESPRTRHIAQPVDPEVTRVRPISTVSTMLAAITMLRRVIPGPPSTRG